MSNFANLQHFPLAVLPDLIRSRMMLKLPKLHNDPSTVFLMIADLHLKDLNIFVF